MTEMFMEDMPYEEAEPGYVTAMKRDLASLKKEVERLETENRSLTQERDELNRRLKEQKVDSSQTADIREQIGGMIDSFNELKQTLTQTDLRSLKKQSRHLTFWKKIASIEFLALVLLGLYTALKTGVLVI